MSEQQKQQPKKPNKPGIKKPKFNFYWIYGILAVLILGMNYFNFQPEPTEINTRREFDTILNSGLQ